MSTYDVTIVSTGNEDAFAFAHGVHDRALGRVLEARHDDTITDEECDERCARQDETGRVLHDAEPATWEQLDKKIEFARWLVREAVEGGWRADGIDVTIFDQLKTDVKALRKRDELAVQSLVADGEHRPDSRADSRGLPHQSPSRNHFAAT